MATAPDSQVLGPGTHDESDYGWDFSEGEEAIIFQVLAELDSKSTRPPPIPEIEDNPIVTRVEQDVSDQSLYVAKPRSQKREYPLYQDAQVVQRLAQQIIDSGWPGEPLQYLSNPNASPAEEPTPAGALSPSSAVYDRRSPLLRFRTKPRKAFSVSDLVAPAWCELQYWYTLTKFGKKKRTPAMRQGSAVHSTLEAEVHTFVTVNTETLEDRWGLRIQNVIQGLRTLRSTGMTRELEVWGTIHGHIVTGIIDELSFTCPDTQLEESTQIDFLNNHVPSDQTTISSFFRSSDSGASLTEALKPRTNSSSNKIYVCDVKTRGTGRLPSKGAFHSTKMQLMLYHQLLGTLATDKFDLALLTARFNLDASKPLSDSLIAQLMSLDEGDEVFYDASSDLERQSNEYQFNEISEWSIAGLWSLMIKEFKLTFPDGDMSIGNVLKVEYRSRTDGEIIGYKTFVNDKNLLAAFIDHEMEWWRGEREPEGVSIEDSYKCYSCDFKETCEWRLSKALEASERAETARRII